jgi:hypothetical protein
MTVLGQVIASHTIVRGGERTRSLIAVVTLTSSRHSQLARRPAAPHLPRQSNE